MTTFEEFKSYVSTRGYSHGLLIWLKSQEQALSRKDFRLFIDDVLIFLKNHREVIHTPTWYGKYVSYTENYSAIRTWVDATQERLTEVESSTATSDWTWIARLAVVFIAAFNAPRAWAENDKKIFVGKSNHSDVFEILHNQQLVIQNWEPAWTTHTGEQSVWDKVDLSQLVEANQEIVLRFRSTPQNSTLLDIESYSPYQKIHIDFVNTSVINFCIGMNPLPKFIIPSYLYNYIDCSESIKLKLYPGTPFVDLRGYEAVPFEKGIYSVHQNMRLPSLKIRLGRVEFEVEAQVRKEFVNVAISNYLKQNSVPIYHVTEKTESMDLALPPYDRFAKQAPALVIFDLPEPNLLMDIVWGVKESLKVEAGKKIVGFRGGRNTNAWLCNDNPPMVRSLIQGTFETTYIDCSAIGWGYPHRSLLGDTQTLVKKYRNKPDHFIKFQRSLTTHVDVQKTTINDPSYYSPDMPFTTNAPWIHVTIYKSIDEAKQYWHLLVKPELHRTVSFGEDWRVAKVEGCPESIRRFFASDPFVLYPFYEGKKHKIILSWSASNHTPPVNTTIFFGVRPKYSRTNMLLFLLNGLNFLGIFLPLYFLITYLKNTKLSVKDHRDRKAHGLSKVLAENDISFLRELDRVAYEYFGQHLPEPVLLHCLKACDLNSKSYTPTLLTVEINKWWNENSLWKKWNVGKKAALIRFYDTPERKIHRYETIRQFLPTLYQERAQRELQTKKNK